MSRGRIDPPQLDDRTWREIVDQTLRLAPQYAGDSWTDRGPSDLGVILIELFGFLVEGLAFRLNQVPERTFVEFLNLLGTTRLPPTPASTMLVFTPNGSVPVDIPAGLSVGTVQTETQPAILFETESATRAVPSNLKAVYSLITGDAAVTAADATARLAASPLSGLEARVEPGKTLTLFLGFDQAIGESFPLRVSGVRIADFARSSVSWAASVAAGWGTALAVQDGSLGLRRPGRIVLPSPASWVKKPLKDLPDTQAPAVKDDLFWLRVVLDPGTRSAGDPPALRQKIDFILLNAVTAVAALSVPETAKENVGQSNGEPFQTFELDHAPLYKTPDAAAPFGHLHVEVEEPQPTGSPVIGEWQPVADLLPGPTRNYRFNPVAGTIMFGDYDSQARPRGAGLIPPRGSVIRAWYRYVASGAEGNVAPNTVTVARPAVPARVSNPGPAVGGSDEEPLEDAKRRAPESLKNRDRAVSIEDVEILALSATTDVSKVRALPPKLNAQGQPETFGNLARSQGTVHVLVVPKDESGARAPRPSMALVQEVRRFLNDRRVVGAAFDVSGPLYLPIKATVTVFIWPSQASGARTDADPAAIRRAIRERVFSFLHPLTGGPQGKGWEIGQMVFAADLFAALQPLIPPTQGFIKGLSLQPALGVPPVILTDEEFHGGPRPGAAQLPVLDGTAGVSVAEFELVCPLALDRHDVNFEPAGAIQGIGFDPANNPAGALPEPDAASSPVPESAPGSEPEAAPEPDARSEEAPPVSAPDASEKKGWFKGPSSRASRKNKESDS